MRGRDERGRDALLTYFSQYGLLLCNENAALPYLELVGGSWNAVVSLMESGDVFYSRFYQNRVTYLSRELYAALKPYRRRLERLDGESARLMAYLDAAGEANAAEMQAACRLDRKAQTKALDRLVSELLATVIRRDATIRENWCTFCYGPAERWEEKHPEERCFAASDEAERLLSGLFTKDQIKKLLK
ncbi:MAG: hypothetical protein GX417_08285 [Clostridiales bacterium]|nr:hypothetical protein [Clostridiales bacterium]